MAVLSSRNGKFYEVPDADLKKYELPAEKVKEVLAGMDEGAGPGVEPYGHGGPAQVVIHVSGGAQVEQGPPPPEGAEGGVQPYGYYGYYGYRPYYWGYRRRHYYYGY